MQGYLVFRKTVKCILYLANYLKVFCIFVSRLFIAERCFVNLYRYQTKLVYSLFNYYCYLPKGKSTPTDRPTSWHLIFLELQLSKSQIDCPFSSAITLCQHLCTGCTVAPNRAIRSNDFLVKWPTSAELELHQLTSATIVLMFQMGCSSGWRFQTTKKLNLL